MRMTTCGCWAAGLAAWAGAVSTSAGDWPMWGHDPSRNMVSTETGLPERFEPGKLTPGGETFDPATQKHVKWVAPLGNSTYGNPVVAGGRVYVGTNNERPRDPRHTGDRGIVLCLEAATGRLLWQLVVPKLGTGRASDYELVGVCSSPTVDGDRVYVVTNRAEVVCLDARGMANGNDGPFTDEGQYLAGPGKPRIEPGPLDADILWVYDLRTELGVVPQNVASSSPLLVGDRLYVTTSNGRDLTHAYTPNPFAPALVVLDAKTGRLLGEEASGVSERTFDCNWSSPAYGEAGGRKLVVFGGGDGFCYGFDAEPAPGPGGRAVLKEAWRFDCNPQDLRMRDGKPLAYSDPDGPSEVIATPVFLRGRVYASVGRDPDGSNGPGTLSCIDASKTGDITKGGAVWTFPKLKRSMSTVAVAGGILVAADAPGFVHALDAETGALFWTHDVKSSIWGSPLIADGKIYIGDKDGKLTIFALAREKKILAEISFSGDICSTVVAANGVLYVAAGSHLYAIRKPE